MKAQPVQQERLLDLQQLDTRLDQLAHRRRTLPENAELTALERDAARLRDLTLAARTPSRCSCHEAGLARHAKTSDTHTA